MCKFPAMLRLFVAMLMLLHASIHLIGFLKAFNLANFPAMRFTISKREGLAWLVAAVLWIATSILLFTAREKSAFILIPAILLSQILIFQHWQEARWGSIANLAMAVVLFLFWTTARFENMYRLDVRGMLAQSNSATVDLLSEAQVLTLPPPVQRYVRRSGAIGKPIPTTMYVKMTGRMRAKGKSFFPFKSEQYNDFVHPSRFFFMEARSMGMRVPGYHRYASGKASMDVRLWGIIPVAHQEGPVMDTTETVTFLNDLCLMAPGALVYPYLQWTAVDSNRANVSIQLENIRVSAQLHIDAQGQLVNFTSQDRTEVNIGKRLPFSTPIHSYQEIDGMTILKDGDGVWDYPDGPFVYGQFHLLQIRYDPKQP